MKQYQHRPVLFADDDKNDRYFFRLAFEEAGLPNPLMTFTDGEEVIAFLGTPLHASPCLLVLDLKMPRVDGFEVLAWLREHQQQPDIQKALGLGAADYCVKPPDYNSLTQVVALWREKWLQNPDDAHLVAT